MTVPKHIQAALISRFKIMAELNIAERRVPQDGRIPVRHEGKDYDMRVSCLPTMFGEKIVMRILDKTSVLLGLNKLGFTPEVQAQAGRDRRPAERHVPDDRADGFRQDDDAVFGSAQDQLGRKEHHHGRRPGRVPAWRASRRCRSTKKPA